MTYLILFIFWFLLVGVSIITSAGYIKDFNNYSSYVYLYNKYYELFIVSVFILLLSLQSTLIVVAFYTIRNTYN